MNTETRMFAKSTFSFILNDLRDLNQAITKKVGYELKAKDIHTCIITGNRDDYRITLIVWYWKENLASWNPQKNKNGETNGPLLDIGVDI